MSEEWASSARERIARIKESKILGMVESIKTKIDEALARDYLTIQLDTQLDAETLAAARSSSIILDLKTFKNGYVYGFDIVKPRSPPYDDRFST
jgi:hypothetical protein